MTTDAIKDRTGAGVLGRTLGRMLGRQGSGTQFVMGAGLLAAALWALNGGPFLNLVGQSCAVYAVAAIGQSVLIGSAGQIALSGAAFMAIGAFVTGSLAGTPLETFPFPLLICAVVGWLVGLLSGLPGLRFRGLYLLLSSLALQFMVTAVTKNYQSARHPAGLEVPPLHIGPLDVSTGQSFYIVLITLLATVYLVVALVERTGVGLAWRAIRESEEAAAVSGVDAVRWKLYAFAMSGAITAVAGCLMAYLVGRADYETYNLNLSIALITMIYIGGIRSRLGALTGAVIITALPYILQLRLPGWLAGLGIDANWYTENQSIANAGLFNLLFLLVVLFEPEGVQGLLGKAERLLRRTLSGRRTGRTTESPA
ncbi:branched-chain amino acid transport system permease protein [Thermomonospora echinospora]|uniref:Branched-chain amino acid transport system permease protein n=1 Tax=Thermomonospora echinospora TaxID=1992 RepID=A0A1H6E5I0_9ACTN|nr:branched-chain amino acid ABC transporter permease [Thermomonospora echinospora]SEG92942.1 branched-chain amino acid transport system permease protein [Thermomonospora echinospora]